MTYPMPPVEPDETELRELALKRLKAKRDFGAHLIAYLSVNAMLVGIWYVTGAAFFWPIFIIMGWGIGIAFNAWDVFSAPPGPDRVAEEMERLRHR